MRTTTVYNLLANTNTKFSNKFVPVQSYDDSRISNPDNIWARGPNIYYSNTLYLLRSSHEWTDDYVYWNNLLFSGKYIWNNGQKIYYSPGGHINYTVAGDNWLPSLPVQGLEEYNSFYGRFVQNFGEATFYNDIPGNKIYMLNNETNTWIQIYNGLGSPEYCNTQGALWSDGESIYFSHNNWQYKLDTDRDVFSSQYWKENNSSRYRVLTMGDRVWTDGSQIYYSDSNGQFILDKGTSNWSTMKWSFEGTPTVIDGECVWSNNGNTYYSNGETQYILDGTLWKSMTWNGIHTFKAYNLWTIGDTVYYSYKGQNYVLNNTTWEPMTWTGSIQNSLDAREIYTINGDIYYSAGGTKHYKLEGTTWTEIDRPSWGTFTSFNGNFVWTNGTNIYYSHNKLHFILNGETWENTVWNGLESFSGTDVWTDGTNTYYSDGSDNYVLNNNTWTKTTFHGIEALKGSNTWTDGSNVFYTVNGNTYALLSNSTHIYTKMNGSWVKMGSLPETSSTT